MLGSQILAIAAHLHVLLRRKTGRVTDTEWMAVNPDYAREIVRFARQKAREDGHADLEEWAGKLEAAVLNAPPSPSRAPLAQVATQMLKNRVPADAPASGFGSSSFGGERPDPDAPRYVGGIR